MDALPRWIDDEAEPEEVPAQYHPVLELRSVCQANLDVEVPGCDLDGRPDHRSHGLVATRVPDPPPSVKGPLGPPAALLQTEFYFRLEAGFDYLDVSGMEGVGPSAGIYLGEDRGPLELGQPYPLPPSHNSRPNHVTTAFGVIRGFLKPAEEGVEDCFQNLTP